MGRRRRRNRLPEGEFEAFVDSVGHDGRGVARVDGKVTFLYGALPQERVRFRYLSRRRQHDEGVTTTVLEGAKDRVEPLCSAYGICGGCSLQHLDPAAQIELKQGIMLDNLATIGNVKPATVLPPLQNASPWGYRRKARLGVRDVVRKGRVLVGFRERGSSLVADVSACHVLHPHVGELLPALGELIESLSIRRRLPQIEVAMDDTRCVLVLRVLDPPTDADREALTRFERVHDVVFYLQPGGPESVAPLGEGVELTYALPDEALSFSFRPTDFTQVNSGINRSMIASAMSLLAPTEHDDVLDLFCGIGNFTLPIARRCRNVVGVEGDSGLVAQARENALRNAIDNTTFYTTNLYEGLEAEPWMQQRFDKALIDPPRSGAIEVLPVLASLGVSRLVYVSCYPGTLARDAGVLVHDHGYRLVSAGVMDMFPHTAHVESIALFERA